VSFTENAEQAVASLRSSFPGLELEARRVDLTVDELEELETAVWQRRQELRDRGAEPLSVGARITLNAVTVGVRDVTAAASRFVAEQFGDDVVLVPEAPRSPLNRYEDSPPPLRGGVNIFNDVRGNRCSTGFVGYRELGSLPGAQRDYFMITAGHCGDNGDPSLHGLYPVGTMVRDSYYSGTSADGGLLSMAEINASNCVYLSPSSSQLIFSTQRDGDEHEGDPVCMSAVTTGNDCGTVTDTSRTVTYVNDGFTLVDQNEAPLRSAAATAGARSTSRARPWASCRADLRTAELSAA